MVSRRLLALKLIIVQHPLHLSDKKAILCFLMFTVRVSAKHRYKPCP